VALKTFPARSGGRQEIRWMRGVYVKRRKKRAYEVPWHYAGDNTLICQGMVRFSTINLPGVKRSGREKRGGGQPFVWEKEVEK